jgi:hypothetical protein
MKPLLCEGFDSHLKVGVIKALTEGVVFGLIIGGGYLESLE